SGSDVYKWAVRRISEAIGEMLAAANLTAGDIDWFVPHSANLRIVEALCARTGNAHEHRRLRQHLNRLDPAGTDAGARRRTHQTRRPPPTLWFRRRSGPRWYA